MIHIYIFSQDCFLKLQTDPNQAPLTAPAHMFPCWCMLILLLLRPTTSLSPLMLVLPNSLSGKFKTQLFLTTFTHSLLVPVRMTLLAGLLVSVLDLIYSLMQAEKTNPVYVALLSKICIGAQFTVWSSEPGTTHRPHTSHSSPASFPIFPSHLLCAQLSELCILSHTLQACSPKTFLYTIPLHGPSLPSPLTPSGLALWCSG